MSHRMEYWSGHLSAIEAEGIGTKAYAQREGLSAAALYHWRKRVKAASGTQERSASFVAVRLDQNAEPKSCALVLGPGVRLELCQLPEPEWLAALSAALRVGVV